ncbi:MAG: 50S ribosomal protein L1 [Candidatus Helarchaeota archaeon]
MPVNSDIIKKAVKEAKNNRNKGNFVQTLDLSINLKEIDLKQPKNRINTEIILPHGPGKDIKICVCTTSGDFALRARQEGLTVLDKDALLELQKNKKEAKKIAKQFDFFIASVEVMPIIAKSLGPVLGPQGKMPLGPPKGSGIVPPTTNIKPLIEKYKKTIRLKMRKSLQINCPVGKEDMDDDLITENILAVITFLENNLEKGLKNIKSIFIKTTMGHSVKVKI